MSPYAFSDSLLETLLSDDSPWGDATTWGLGIGDAPGRMTFRARHAQVVCCSEEAARMATLRGLRIDGPVVASGSAVEPGTTLLTVCGRAADLHLVWKPAQTLMEYAGGIATATAELVAAARGAGEVAVACTRKHLPGSKAMSVKAILAGGAVPHRLSLSDTLLVFAEHRAFLAEEPAATVARLHRAWPERQVVVEVAGADEASIWIAAGADVIQLEKCTPETVAAVVARAADTPVRIAAAGGVKAANAAAYVAAGAHVLVSSAPYNAPPRDIAVTIEAV
jgi:molybdenum transport protein